MSTEALDDLIKIFNTKTSSKVSIKQKSNERTTLYSTTTKNPWGKVNTTSNLSNIMKQQMTVKPETKESDEKQTNISDHNKTTSSNVDKSTLQFYYEDDMKPYTQKQLSSEELIAINNNENEIIDDNISKHNAKIWSETHINRLNEYETGGNLNTKMNIGNQCYNAFRNQLDKKGFITYHNYQLQPKDKKK
eukprot:102275_1